MELGEAWKELLDGLPADRKERIEAHLRQLDERSRLLEEVIDEMPFEYVVETGLFRIPQKYHLSGKVKDRSKKYMTLEESLSDIYEEEQNKFKAFIRGASKTEMSGVVDYRLNVSSVEHAPRFLWYRTVYRSILGEDGTVAWIIGRSYDISSDRAIQEKLSEEVQLDPLTRLYNKVAVGKKIDEFLEGEAEGLHALFLIDIDDFKNINDTFGHTVGDTVISDIAQTIRGQFRPTDVVGRVGGDEFLVFMKNTSLEAVKERAEWLCHEAKKKLIGDEAIANLTLSVGVSLYGADGRDYETLYEMADRAMYHTKRNGKNNFSFARKGEKTGYHSIRSTKSIDTDYKKSLGVDKDFLNFAFSLLAHAKDINGSLNVLLEQIGKKFELDTVSVVELSEDGMEGNLSNCWSSFGPPYGQKMLPKLQEKLVNAENGVFIDFFGDKETADKSVMESWEHKPVKLRHVAGIKFEYAGGSTGILYIGMRRNTKPFPAPMVSTFRELARAVGVFVTLRNQISNDQKEITNLQNHDNLTGIYNIEAFRREAERVLNAAKKEAEKGGSVIYAMVYMDINNFSYVNENFGQRVGNAILKKFAARLMKESHTAAACRMYSDHFLILVSGESEEEICRIINYGNLLFKAELKRQYPAGTLWLSAGICFIENYDENFDSVIESANIARKKAKTMKNQEACVFSKSMWEKRDKEARVVGSFYAALQNGEIEMFLQPKFLLKEKKLYGAEALARWRLPDGTYLPPYQFVPALENMGYIVDLDFYIFEVLLETMHRWQEAGRELFTVSTNFSRKHFADGGEKFLNRIKSLMKQYKEIDPSCIEVEVTESVITEDLETLQGCLCRLEKMGFRIAIDDFGTGYSSLSVLMEIPAHVVKIDKSFTDRIHMGQQDFVSGMGHFLISVKDEVIFEGIEDEEQCDFLIDNGFALGQGYLFDKPIPVAEFERKYFK